MPKDTGKIVLVFDVRARVIASEGANVRDVWLATDAASLQLSLDRGDGVKLSDHALATMIAAELQRGSLRVAVKASGPINVELPGKFHRAEWHPNMPPHELTGPGAIPRGKHELPEGTTWGRLEGGSTPWVRCPRCARSWPVPNHVVVPPGVTGVARLWPSFACPGPHCGAHLWASLSGATPDSEACPTCAHPDHGEDACEAMTAHAQRCGCKHAEHLAAFRLSQ